MPVCQVSPIGFCLCPCHLFKCALLTHVYFVRSLEANHTLYSVDCVLFAFQIKAKRINITQILGQVSFWVKLLIVQHMPSYSGH